MPHKRNFTTEEEARIVERYKAGVPAATMAREYGCGSLVMKRVLTAHGAYEPGRKFGGQYTPTQKQEMVDRYNAGESQKSLAADFGCTPSNIQLFLKRRGVTLRTYPSFPLDDATAAIITTERAAGQSFVRIAELLGVPHHRALRWGRQMGLSKFDLRCGENSNLWKGGTVIQDGYRYVTITAEDPMARMINSLGYVSEHRLVVARRLGRPLVKGETVHHINGDTLDNCPENLQLRQGQHGRGVVLTCRDCGSHNISSSRLSEVTV